MKKNRPVPFTWIQVGGALTLVLFGILLYMRNLRVQGAVNQLLLGVKMDYFNRMGAQLKEWDEKLDGLRRRAETASAGGKAELYQLIDRCEGKLDEAERMLREFSEAGDSRWESVRKDIDHTFNNLKSTYEDLVKRFA